MLRFTSEELELELLPEVGGRIHRLRAFGRDLLRTPADPAAHAREPFYWGSYPIVPWFNRVPEGRVSFRGRTVQLPVNDPPFAIHGEAYARPWREVGEGELVFQGGTFGFPWPYEARQRFRLDGARLVYELSLTNSGDKEMPAGLGIHPWFVAAGGLRVALPATLAYPLENFIPVADPQPVAGRLDRRALSPVPWGTDDVWTGLTERRIAIDWPEWDLAVDYTFSEAADHVVLAAFERFGAVAVEPVTHATDGFHLLAEERQGAIDVLPPGATLSVTYEVAARRR